MKTKNKLTPREKLSKIQKKSNLEQIIKNSPKYSSFRTEEEEKSLKPSMSIYSSTKLSFKEDKITLANELFEKIKLLIPKLQSQTIRPLPYEEQLKSVIKIEEKLPESQAVCVSNFIKNLTKKTSIKTEIVQIIIGNETLDNLKNRISDLTVQKLFLYVSTNRLCFLLSEVTRLHRSSEIHLNKKDKDKAKTKKTFLKKIYRMENFSEKILLIELHFESLYRNCVDVFQNVENDFLNLTKNQQFAEPDAVFEDLNGHNGVASTAPSTAENGCVVDFDFSVYPVTDFYQRKFTDNLNDDFFNFEEESEHHRNIKKEKENKLKRETSKKMRKSKNTQHEIHEKVEIHDVNIESKPNQINSGELDPVLEYLLKEKNLNDFLIFFQHKNLTFRQIISLDKYQFQSLGIPADKSASLEAFFKQNLKTLPDSKLVIVKCEWLYKLGEVVKNWKKRYFYFTDSFELFYFSTPSSSKPIGSISMRDVTSVSPILLSNSMNSHAKHKNCFRLQTPTRAWIFSSSSESCTDWSNLLANVVKYLSVSQ